MKKYIAISFLLIIAYTQVYAQELMSMYLQKESYLNIHVKTNVNSFRLVHDGTKIAKNCSQRIVATQTQNRLSLSQSTLSLKMIDFSSENSYARRDFLALVKSHIFPELQVQLKYVDISPADLAKANSKGMSCVNITLMGITRQYCIPVTTSLNGNQLTFDGKKQISIRDFNIVPPEELFGLIKVDENIEVDFHFVCKTNMNEVSVAKNVVKRK